MAEKSKVFMLIPTEKQMETISAWCFNADKCGAVYFSGLEMEMGKDEKGEPVFVAGLPCPRPDCPVVEKEMDESVGEVQGDPVFIRKLKEDLGDNPPDDDGQVTVRTSSLTAKDLLPARPCGNTDCHYHEESVVLSHCDRHAIEDVTSCSGYGDKLEYIPPDFS